MGLPYCGGANDVNVAPPLIEYEKLMRGLPPSEIVKEIIADSLPGVAERLTGIPGTVGLPWHEQLAPQLQILLICVINSNGFVFG
jgi:hypothetical protein